MAQKKYHHGDLKNALIRAGVEVLAADGVKNFSLRKAALKAGVSHSAPYAHFKGKQELIAAISTEGFRQLHLQIDKACTDFKDEPDRQLLEVAWAYVQFAEKDPQFFKVIFSGVLENEKDYPDFVEISQKTFQMVVDVVRNNQRGGVLQDGDPNIFAVGIWSMVHGFTNLLLENQISHKILEKQPLKELLAEIIMQKISLPIKKISQ